MTEPTAEQLKKHAEILAERYPDPQPIPRTDECKTWFIPECDEQFEILPVEARRELLYNVEMFMHFLELNPVDNEPEAVEFMRRRVFEATMGAVQIGRRAQHYLAEKQRDRVLALLQAMFTSEEEKH